MPNPNMRRGLKAGKGGKREGAGRKTAEYEEIVRKKALALLNSPAHQAALKAKMDDLTLHPSIYNAYLYFAYGKPRESVEVKQIVPVTIRHEYADEDPTKKKKDDES